VRITQQRDQTASRAAQQTPAHGVTQAPRWIQAKGWPVARWRKLLRRCEVVLTRSLVVAAVPLTGAAVLAPSTSVVVLVAVTEVAALAILRLSQIRLQGQGSKGALKVLDKMDGAASVTVNVDGSFHVRRHPPTPEQELKPTRRVSTGE
jgi:hypothetical protein